MDETLSRIVQELESRNPSKSALEVLRGLLDSSIDLNTLLAKLRRTPLVDSLSSTMDNGSDGIALSASYVYLSLFLSPISNDFSLFAPVTFLSLLGSIQRAINKASSLSLDGHVEEKKRSRGGRNSKAEREGKNVDDDENEQKFD